MIRLSGSKQEWLARRDVLRIQFCRRRIGTVALGLAQAGGCGEPPPLEVAVHAGPLSFPVELWSKSDRAAKRLMGWMERLLLALVEPTKAQYGALG